jgi:hypothetical protein
VRWLAVLLLSSPVIADVATPEPKQSFSLPWPKTLPCARFSKLGLAANPPLDVTWRGRRYHAPLPGEHGKFAEFDIDDAGVGGTLLLEKLPLRLGVGFYCSDGGKVDFYWNRKWSWSATYHTLLDGTVTAAPRDDVTEILGDTLRVVDTACRRVGCTRPRHDVIVGLIRQAKSFERDLSCTESAAYRQCTLSLCRDREPNLRIIRMVGRDTKGNSLHVYTCGEHADAVILVQYFQSSETLFVDEDL